MDEYSYTVFGKPYRKNLNGLYKPVAGANDSSIGNTRLFTGREYDKEVSLYFNRARYYDPSLGRFISRDPIGMKDNVNLYTYVANSPVKYVDRTGTEKLILGAIYNAQSVQIDLVARRIQGIGGIIGVHTFIQFDITDHFGNSSSYSIGGHDPAGNLVATFNDTTDVGWTGKEQIYSITIPTGMTGQEFATNITNEAIFYNKNQKQYDLVSISNESGNGGNCNNLSTTLLVRGSNYSTDIINFTQTVDPSGWSPGLGEAFAPICTN